MASDAVSPYLTSMTLFFFLLLLVSNTTMADKNLRFSPLVASRDGSMKRSNMEFTSRKLGVGKSKTNSTCKSESTTANAIHVPSPGRRKERYQASKSPLPWQDKIFNASEHEVPSGPNPISNR
ncbi:hypothetical protein RGQ29_006583 [Quercus rubra]|uniref:Uncharacterized protein n=1 Tax=Quercus rubra TaxID=3512 RepID=A0AAN7IC22_QUERU|nr:hypothetical protein RGQ29_006583 [Quercus rubra]